MKSLYILTMSDGYTKLGISKHPSKRLDQIKTYNPHKVESFRHYRINGAKRLERQLHARFDAHRVAGEWFALSSEILSGLHREMNQKAGLIESAEPDFCKSEILKTVRKHGSYFPCDLDSLYLRYGIDCRAALEQLFKKNVLYIDPWMRLREFVSSSVGERHDNARIKDMLAALKAQTVHSAHLKYGLFSDHGLDFYSKGNFAYHVGMPYETPGDDEVERACRANGLERIGYAPNSSWGDTKVIVLKRVQFSLEPFPFLQWENRGAKR